jgi:hypothetical protein
VPEASAAGRSDGLAEFTLLREVTGSQLGQYRPCQHDQKQPGQIDGMGPSAIAKDELIAPSQTLQWDRCTLCGTANVSHVKTIRATRPQRKGPPARPMVPKASKAFSLAIALPCDASSLHADWLAAAGLMLALHWPSGPRPLDAGLWTLVPSDTLPSALVAFGARRFRLGTVRETRSINRRYPTAVPTNSPDDYQEFRHEI